MKFEYRITLLYILLGILWIFFSDKLILYFVQDPQLLTDFQSLKGLTYVGVTGLLFYFFLKRHLIKLRKAESDAKESDRLKTVFLQNMSHEIRTPMNGIIGFAKMLEKEDLSYDKKEKYIRVIIRSTNQLLTVIDDLLDISMLETGNYRLNKSNLNLNKTLEALYNQNQQIAPKGIKFLMEKGLPDEKCTLYSDESKIKKVFDHLIRNAFKFTSDGFVKFGYRCSENKIEFFVEDSGIGIAKENQEKIFNRFQQADDSITRTYGGTGLGLAICKGILSLMDGSICVESELGKGSVFYFTLSDSFILKETAETSEVIIAVMHANKINLLIAEDEEINFIYLTELLHDEPYNILRAENGSEAVEICKTQPVDLVLMDIKMPVLDGFDATRQIREFNHDLPIIAQTAYTITDYHIKAIEAGCNSYISKPYEREQLISLIKHYHQ